MAKVGRPKKKTLSEQMMTRQTSWEFSTFIWNLPDPDRVLSKLGIDEDQAFEDILTDDHLTAVWNKRVSAVTDLEWNIEQGKASESVTKEIRAIFENIDVYQFTKDVMSALLHGRAPIEIVWDTSGRYWVPSGLYRRPVRWFEFDEENRIKFHSNESMLDGVFIPDYKLLLPRNNPTYDNPYGEKLLSKCYWPITWKRNAYRWWNVFMEKFSIPYIFAKVPANTGDTEKSAIIDMLDKLVQDSVATIPDTGSVEIIESGNKSGNGELFNAFKYAQDSAVSKVILGGTLTTEQGEVGSYALGNVQKEGENQLRNDDKRMIEETVNILIDYIMHFNFSGPSPTFNMQASFEASKDLAERDKILKETGVKFTKEYFLKNHGLEEEDFDMVEDAEVIPEEPEEQPFSKNFLDQVALLEDENTIGAVMDTVDAKELDKQSKGILKPIIEIVKKSDSYEEVRNELLNQWPKMDSETLEEMILQAIFTSEAVGRLEVS